MNNTVCVRKLIQLSPRKLEERQHFVEEENLYSLQDLVDVESGVLGTWLGQVSSFRISPKKTTGFLA